METRKLAWTAILFINRDGPFDSRIVGLNVVFFFSNAKFVKFVDHMIF